MRCCNVFWFTLDLPAHAILDISLIILEKESSSKQGANNGEKKEKSGDTKNKTENSIKQEKPKKKSVPTTNDDVRQKCREMLANSLSLANSETSKGIQFLLWW